MHKCCIGLYHGYEGPYLITVDDLKEIVIEDFEAYQYKLDMGLHPKSPMKLLDYFDKRKSTPLTRFEYCPECGKRIDWAQLKKDYKG